MNVLAYVKSFTDHKLIKTYCLFFCNNFTFIISTDILMLLKIYFLVMKGKRRKSDNNIDNSNNFIQRG